MLFSGTIVLLFGIYILQLPIAAASLSWPTVEGSILSSEVYEQCCGEYAEGWFPKVSYSYSVGGKEYISDKVEFVSMGDGNTNYFAQQVIRRYPVGKRVKVYYNSLDPAVAVLEPGIPDNHYFFYLILTVTTLAALVRILGMLGVLGIVKLPSSDKIPQNPKRID